MLALALIEKPPVSNREYPSGQHRRPAGIEARQDGEQLRQKLLDGVLWIADPRVRQQCMHRPGVAAQKGVLRGTVPAASALHGECVQLHWSQAIHLKSDTK